jgi:glycerol-3-phosphate dehydrogenase (NAD(P)+)
MNNKISIIGAGSWGTTLSIVLAQKGLDVTLHGVFREHNLKMIEEKENRDFLSGAKFPANLKIAETLETAMMADIIVIAIPVKYIRTALRPLLDLKIDLRKKIFVSISKGIEAKSLKRVSQVIHEILGNVPVAVLSGPNIAKEVLRGVPSTAVIACKDKRLAMRLQKVFNTDKFRVYTHNDIIGVELAAALKNVVAIACGIADGMGFGTNTKAALLTRGLVEITRLGKKLGARADTFWGVSGLGDLATTCFSTDSRNRFVGQEIGGGKNIKDILSGMETVAEGLETVKSAYMLSRKLKIDMPISCAVYDIVYKNKPLEIAVKGLMHRALKPEKVD